MYGGLVSGLYNKMGDLQHSVVWLWQVSCITIWGTYNIGLYGSGRFLV